MNWIEPIFDGNARAVVLARKNKTKELDTMLIGAAVAGLLIVSLFLEMLVSSPKPVRERETAPPTVK